MANVPLRDILIHARQESARMRHFYLGVEHLFIALLEIQGGLATSILEDQGLTADYVIDAIRRKTGKGGKQRLWAGMPNSPRAEVVLGIANDLALERKRTEIDERDLMSAILEERDNIPSRVLQNFGLDLDQLVTEASQRDIQSAGPKAYTNVTFGPDFDTSAELSEEQLFILRRMFHNYGQIRIERKLDGGYTSAVLLVVTPIHPDGREDAPTVVKTDLADTILDEAKRYELHIKGSLPPLTARIEDKPTAPETSDLAGIQYTFVGDVGSTQPRDLRSMTSEWDAQRVGAYLRVQVFPYFGKTWWMQRRMYRFQAWMEYDWLLPPLLTLELIEGDEPPPDSTVLKDPVKRSRIRELDYGHIVVVENFTVQKVYPQRKEIRLSIGRGTEAAKRAFPIDVRETETESDFFFRGELVEQVIGRVIKTRQEALNMAASALEPDFDVHAESIPGVGAVERLPNPIRYYEDVLEMGVTGSLSKIHGDLHLGNILVGPGNSPFLIDFAQSREGHTLSDWAMLEVSLLSTFFSGRSGNEWAGVRRVAAQVADLNAATQGEAAPTHGVAGALAAVGAVREVVRGCLQTEDNWQEYFVALALCSLRAVTWDTMSLGARRLMFVVSALSMYELRRKQRGGSGETPLDDDLTDSGGPTVG